MTDSQNRFPLTPYFIAYFETALQHRLFFFMLLSIAFFQQLQLMNSALGGPACVVFCTSPPSHDQQLLCVAKRSATGTTADYVSGGDPLSWSSRISELTGTAELHVGASFF
jgi:hypothetical protein